MPAPRKKTLSIVGAVAAVLALCAIVGTQAAKTLNVSVTKAHGARAGDGQTARATLPMPKYHHIHLNSVDPDKSLKWYATY